MPLTAEQTLLLNGATEDNHLDVLKELKADVTPWNQCNLSERKTLAEGWSKRWAWRTVEGSRHDTDLEASASPPWQAVRLIGHRGSGKTDRPVLQ